MLIVAVGCSSKKEAHIEQESTLTAEQIYRNAISNLAKKNLKKAASEFNKVAYEFPYHEFAVKSEVMEIYVNYLMGEYDNVIVSAEHFIKLHPANESVPYVMYLRSLSYYEQIDIPFRDQENTKQAKKSFIELSKRFPKSKYTKDARIKMELINDHLAANEMIIGKYYLNNGSILSAINRYKEVVDRYSTTSHIQEALFRLVESYYFLGLKQEAKRNAAVLGANYPASIWYKKSYNLLKK